MPGPHPTESMPRLGVRNGEGMWRYPLPKHGKGMRRALTFPPICEEQPAVHSTHVSPVLSSAKRPCRCSLLFSWFEFCHLQLW